MTKKESIIIMFCNDAGTDESLSISRAGHGFFRVKMTGKHSGRFASVLQLDDLGKHLQAVADLMRFECAGPDATTSVQLMVPGMPTVMVSSVDFSSNTETQEYIWSSIKAWSRWPWVGF